MKSIVRVFKTSLNICSSITMNRWIPRQVLVLSKLSALEILKIRNPDLNEKQLIEQLRKQGKEHNEILHEHRSQLACEDKVGKVLKKLNINFRFTKRYNSLTIIHLNSFLIILQHKSTSRILMTCYILIGRILIWQIGFKKV